MTGLERMAAELPVGLVLPALLDGLAARSNAVLVAPPGAGKTTLVPLALLDAAWRGDGRIVVLEPRRLAARAAAMRMSAMIGEAVGGLVGYRTRVDAAVSARTRVEVVTEGLLVARLLGEPTLEGVAAVVFDEVHERTLDGDLALALCLDLQRSRPELRLLAMSATADADGLAALMDGALVHRSEGRMFAVDVRHATRDLGHVRELAEGVARGVRAALAEGDGDVLAFLPGKAEIGRAAGALRDCGAEVMALHGEMRPEEQASVLRPGTGGRRVVLATSIAETSLTVPGVRTVVDGGFRRTPRLDAGSGLARLATLRISRAAADQRAGRAGREAPGRCLRLWTRASQLSMAPFDRPEMLEAELSGFRLALACWEEAWGTAPDGLRFADAPPRGAFEGAEELLRDLGAMDAAGGVTALGRGMSRLGTHPRLAAMMLSAGSVGEAALAADLAALLEERDPLGGRDRVVTSADVGLRLAAISGGGGDADRGAIGRIRDASEGFRRRLRVERGTQAAGEPAALLAAAFPDRIAQGRGEAGSFRLSGGGSASLPATDPLAREALLVAAGLHLGKSARITLAARLDPAALPDGLLARTTETVERGVDPRTGAVFNRSRRRLGTLVMADRLLPASAEDVAGHLAAEAAGRLDTVLDWTEAARNLQARVGLARAQLDPGLPDCSDAALAEDAAGWLAPAIAAAGIGRIGDLAKLDVLALLGGRLTAGQRALLERELPAVLVLPRGRASVDYTGDGAVASGRAQVFYGLDRTPAIAGGRVGLSVSLLSPAGRPIAVTADLARFWRGGWADARRDMRGRYPRHDWPDEPWRV
jgi:ATP-dependent helicase HrpB